MAIGALGKIYADGENIVKQGESGDCMYEILEGKVEVWDESSAQPLKLAVLKKGDFFGEMAIFEREVRSASVRAKGEVRALTIDKKNLLRRISEDPSLAFRILENMSHRIRDVNRKLAQSQEKD